MQRYPSHERLLLMRNLSYGGAAVCLAVLAGLTQVGAKTEALQVSVYGAAIAVPIWLFAGSAYEYYIFLGEKSFPHFRSRLVRNTLGGAMALAGFCTLGMASGIIWFLIPGAAYAFAISAFIALASIFLFHAHLAHWWYRSDGPGTSEGEDEV